MPPPAALFTGLLTLDVIYLVETVPLPNQKIVALDSLVAAGGPATNAAIAFQHLGGQATILGVLGQHPTAELIRTDLRQWGVTWVDLQPEREEPPPISSILVTQGTGERAVVSLNAVRSQVDAGAIPAWVWEAIAQQQVRVVLVDGHQMAVAEAIARYAKGHGVVVVADCGSWKVGFERVLPWVDYALCAESFRPPGCDSGREVFAYLRSLNIPYSAITHGDQPIEYCGKSGSGTVAVPLIQPVDTLGAGDFFHGAFCHFIGQEGFQAAIAKSSQIATRSCEFFGTRQWMTDLT